MPQPLQIEPIEAALQAIAALEFDRNLYTLRSSKTFVLTVERSRGGIEVYLPRALSAIKISKLSTQNKKSSL